MRHVFMLTVLVALVAGDSRARNRQAEFNKPFPPHKVVGNVYCVGSEQLASYLITTPEGHGSFYNLTEKYARLEKGGGSNPFIDPEGFKQYVDRSEKTFQARLEEQKKAATK